jgi:hypothetical protein
MKTVTIFAVGLLTSLGTAAARADSPMLPGVEGHGYVVDRDTSLWNSDSVTQWFDPKFDQGYLTWLEPKIAAVRALLPQTAAYLTSSLSFPVGDEENPFARNWYLIDGLEDRFAELFPAPTNAPLEAVVSQNQLLRVASAVKTEREDGTEALIVVAKADGIRLAKDYFYSLSAQDRGRLLLKALIANGDLPAVPRTGELDAALALLENIDSQTDSLTLATELRSKVYCRGPLYNILTLDVPLTPQEALITPCTVGF